MIYLKLSWRGPIWGLDYGPNSQRSGFKMTWEDWHAMPANADGASCGLFHVIILACIAGTE
jgi:hypothetical protein